MTGVSLDACSKVLSCMERVSDPMTASAHHRGKPVGGQPTYSLYRFGGPFRKAIEAHDSFGVRPVETYSLKSNLLVWKPRSKKYTFFIGTQLLWPSPSNLLLLTPRVIYN